MTDAEHAQQMAINPAYWAEHNRIKLQKGRWSFENRRYLVEPMTSVARNQCYMKAAQGGVTEMEVNRCLHGMIYGRYPGGVLYLFPTANDIGAFSQSRFGPLIADNLKSIGKFVQSTNSTYLKRVGTANLFLRGGTLPKTLDMNAREAASLRGITVDKVVFDEEDIMDPEAVGKARSRMDDSDIREEVHISNPTIPGWGISVHFEKSDQRYWFRKCRHCNTYTSATLEFPGCVKHRADGTGFIACRKCKKETFSNDGTWIAQNKTDDPRQATGYQWSQLDSHKWDPAEILHLYTDPPEGNLGNIVNYKLGQPYVAAEDQLTQSEVFACCGPEGQLSTHDGPCAIGIDCQKPKRVVIGARTGRDSYTIFRVMPYSDTNWDGLLELARKFRVKSAVIDIRPYEDSARQCQRKLKRMGVMTWLCEYSDSTPLGWQFNNRTGICKVNRTEILDLSHRVVVTPGQLSLPRRVIPEIQLFVKQMCNTAKIYDSKAGIYRYRKLGADDYRHAFNYFLLAASSGKIGMANVTYRQQRATFATDERDQQRGPENPRVNGRLAYAIG